MKISSIKYYIQEAFRNLFKNGLMTFASIVTVSSCILIVITSIGIGMNLDFVLADLEAKMGISVFLDETIGTDEVKQLQENIENIEGVDTVIYISKEDGLAQLTDQLGEENGIVAGLKEDNPLPRSFKITVNNIKNQNYVISTLKSMQKDGISSVSNGKQVVDFLISLNNVLRIGGIIFILVLSIISVVIIVNTVKITVNIRKTEINIMKYVGATNWFIRWPFVIEGVMIGLIGAIIPIGIGVLSYTRVIAAISNISLFNGVFELLTTSDLFPVIIPVALFFGIGIGVIGSVTSMRRHLNV